MEYLVHTFNRITSWFKAETNLEYAGHYSTPPATIQINPVGLQNHQKTCLVAFSKTLYRSEIEMITQDLKRSEANLESILEDFFKNDIDDHVIPDDHHTAYGIQCTIDAFRPPFKARPVHILDIQHHYPYKWNVNAEAPFSTNKRYLDQRPTFGNFIALKGMRNIDLEDFNRRYTNQDSPDFLETVVPAKFGFMKEIIFNETRKMHHIIKSNFSDHADYPVDHMHLKNRFIFPMLLHSKTAIIKKDDPNKMRTIWGYPKPAVIGETQFYWEYLAWIKANPGHTPMLWGFETFTGGWMRLNAVLFASHVRSSFITIDWSRFDKFTYFTLMRTLLYRVRYEYLDFSRGYAPTKDYPEYPDWDQTHEQRLDRLWLWTLENLFMAPIVLPNGDMYRRRFGGLPSGLFITQLLDSLYNYTMLSTLLSALGFDPKRCIIKVQGDDSVIRLGILIPPNKHEAFINKLAELGLKYFNAHLHTAKSEIRNELNGVEVLSYRNHNGFPHRDEIKLLAQLYHTKARSPTPEITMGQAIGTAYASCANHQRVYLACKEIYDYYFQQGYSPSRAGISVVFGNSPDLPDYDIPLDHFPTKNEIRKDFFNMHYDNSRQIERTWPLSHFLNAPCSV